MIEMKANRESSVSMNWIQLVSQLLADGITCELPFSGSSMHPTIQSGCILHVKPLSSVEIGGIYLFKELNPEGYVLVAHRCVDIHDELGIFRGDARTHNDPPVRLSSVLGEVVKWQQA